MLKLTTKQAVTLMATLAMATATGQSASAFDFGKEFSHLNPLNPDTVIRPNDLPHPHPVHSQPSEIQVVTSPSIDNNGNIWSGSGSGGHQGQIVGKANLQNDAQGLAWWVSNYQNIYGRVQNRRAPQFDRPVVQPQPVSQPAIQRLQGVFGGANFFFDGNGWVEQNSVASFRYVETGRDAQFVFLADPVRQLNVALGYNQYLIRNFNQPNFQVAGSGVWTR